MGEGPCERNECYRKYVSEHRSVPSISSLRLQDTSKHGSIRSIRGDPVPKIRLLGCDRILLVSFEALTSSESKSRIRKLLVHPDISFPNPSPWRSSLDGWDPFRKLSIRCENLVHAASRAPRREREASGWCSKDQVPTLSSSFASSSTARDVPPPSPNPFVSDPSHRLPSDGDVKKKEMEFVHAMPSQPENVRVRPGGRWFGGRWNAGRRWVARNPCDAWCERFRAQVSFSTRAARYCGEE